MSPNLAFENDLRTNKQGPEEQAMLCSRVETETIISIKQDIKKKILALFQETFQFLFWIHVGNFPMNRLTVK